MTYALLLVAMSLAAYAVYRLLGEDKLPFLADARWWLTDWIARRGDGGGGGGFRDGIAWARGIDCSWCLGAWCAFAVVGLTWRYHPLPLPGLWFAAVRAGVGIIGVTVSKLEQPRPSSDIHVH